MNTTKTIRMMAVAALAAVAATSCGGGQKGASDEEPILKDAFAGKFLIGVAVNDNQVLGRDSLAKEIIRKHFNTIVAENVMKSEELNPQKGVYNWGPADRFVDFGVENDMFVVGHTLVWHSQLAPWFPYDDNGNYVSADTLRERMRTYIHDVVGRYKGRVKGWDVVNEVINDDGSYRKSPFYEILGEEYIPYAFELAHEADPDAELYLNDYAMDKPAKREAYVKLLNDLKKRGLRVDAIGMQSHAGMDYPDFEEYEKSMEAFIGTGTKVMMTEWDMSALPSITQSANIADTTAFRKEMNPYTDGLPADVDSVWNARMAAMLDIAMRHSDDVIRINAWGVIDRDSWKNYWPMRGRTDYPLLFDREYKMKPFIRKAAEAASKTTTND